MTPFQAPLVKRRGLTPNPSPEPVFPHHITLTFALYRLYPAQCVSALPNTPPPTLLHNPHTSRYKGPSRGLARWDPPPFDSEFAGHCGQPFSLSGAGSFPPLPPTLPSPSPPSLQLSLGLPPLLPCSSLAPCLPTPVGWSVAWSVGWLVDSCTEWLSGSDPLAEAPGMQGPRR